MTILVILWAVAILLGVLALKGIRRKERLMERRSCILLGTAPTNAASVLRMTAKSGM